MAKIWYEGNLNLEMNRREEEGITYYVRGTVESQEDIYERYGIHTHFIQEGEDYMALMKQYVLPLYKPGDLLSISEKVIAMCQRRTVAKSEIKLGFFAKWLSRFATKTKSGIGMDEPYKLQLVINMKGLPMVLFASMIGGIGKLFHKRGLFYRILGKEVAGLDGLYPHSAFEKYHDLAVLLPEAPDKVCEQIEEELGIAAIIVDANDASVEILGQSKSLEEKKDQLAQLISDNPAGQDDEQTPFILIHKLSENQIPQPYVPVEAI